MLVQLQNNQGRPNRVKWRRLIEAVVDSNYMYSGTVLEHNFKVSVIYLSVFMLCYINFITFQRQLLYFFSPTFTG